MSFRVSFLQVSGSISHFVFMSIFPTFLVPLFDGHCHAAVLPAAAAVKGDHPSSFLAAAATRLRAARASPAGSTTGCSTAGTTLSAPEVDAAWQWLAACSTAARIPFLCGTGPVADWALLDVGATAVAATSRAPCGPLPPRFAFGLHPWWLAEASSFDSAAAAAEPSAVRVTWRTYLRALLLAHPTACVGEIGLDKISAERDAAAAAAPQQGFASAPTQPAPSGAGLYAAQLDAFNFQLDLAAELKRPAIIHCVRAPGPLLDTFAARPIDRYPPAVYMHGFTGSGELAASLLRLSKGRGARFYFGVGTATTGTLKTCDALLKALPRDRVVVESDMHVGGAFFAGAAAAAGAVPAACCGGDEGTGGTEVKSALLLLGQTPDEVHRALTSMRARLAAARPEEWALPETPGAELPLLVSAFDAVSMPPEAL